MQQELLEKLEKIHQKGEKTSQMMGNLDTQKKLIFDQIDKFFQEVILKAQKRAESLKA